MYKKTNLNKVEKLIKKILVSKFMNLFQSTVYGIEKRTLEKGTRSEESEEWGVGGKQDEKDITAASLTSRSSSLVASLSFRASSTALANSGDCSAGPVIFGTSFELFPRFLLSP
jgi:uncharacterized protein YqhQ